MVKKNPTRKRRAKKQQDETSKFQRFYCALKFYYYRKRLEEEKKISSEEVASLLGKGLRSIQLIEEGEILPDPAFIRKCCQIFSEELKLQDPDGNPFLLRYQDFYGDEYWKAKDFMKACNLMKDWKNKLIIEVLETGYGKLVNWDGKRRVVFELD
ncbi:MAG: hypothetical protein D6785_02330 [Planctomycetota bacterium]|nr:MAG: hypothetical protein D6785_02330 [Planctomycetota bacterium]